MAIKITSKVRWIKNIVIFLILGTLLVLIIAIPPFISWGVAILLGSLIWTAIYFFFLFRFFFGLNKPNQAIVISSLLTSERKYTAEELTDPQFTPAGQRVVMEAGFFPKDLWETLGKPIDLGQEVDAGNTMLAQDRRGLRYKLTYSIPLTPIRDERALIRYQLISHEQAAITFRAPVEAAVLKGFRPIAEDGEKEEDLPDGEDIVADMKEFSNEHVAPLFGGDNGISVEEWASGRLSKRAFITKIEKEKSAQDIAEGKQRIAHAVEGLELFKQAAGEGVDPSTLAALTANLIQPGSAEAFIVTGMGAGSHFSVGGSLSNRGGGKGKKDGNKDNNKGGN